MSTLKRNLLTVIDNGNAKVEPREISACRVDCVWPKRVTYQSAARLVTRAKEINASFEILGCPKPVTDEADISEGKAASAGQVADSPGAQEKEKEEEEEEEEEEGAEPDRKRPCLDTSEGAPPGKQAKETPAADNSQPASQGARQAASAFAPPPSHLLCLKAMTAASRLEDKFCGDDPHKYKITCWRPLGSGSHGTVYAGISRGAVPQQVAIKVFRRGPRTKDAIFEVELCCTLSPHPYIVKLLDIGLFEQLGKLGLVFEAFDTDLRKFLQLQPLRLAGMRHVLRSALKALAHVHERGLIHADFKPANMLLRGVGDFQRGFLKLLETAALAEVPPAAVSASSATSRNVAASTIQNKDLEVDLANHLPWCFEVGCSPPTLYPDLPPPPPQKNKKVEQILPSLSPNAHTPPKIIRTVRFELFVGGRGAGLSGEVGQKR